MPAKKLKRKKTATANEKTTPKAGKRSLVSKKKAARAPARAPAPESPTEPPVLPTPSATFIF